MSGSGSSPLQAIRVRAWLRALCAASAAIALGVLYGVVGPAPAAFAAPDGQLTVRAFESDCGFRNSVTQVDGCVDVPGVWYPSEFANWAAITHGPAPADCDPLVTTIPSPAVNLGSQGREERIGQVVTDSFLTPGPAR